MKIILFSIGTRGDVEPFITLGELLKNKGHQVICAFPQQFEKFVDGTGLGFLPLSKDFIKLIEGEDAKIAMGGKVSFVKKIGAYYRLYKLSEDVNKTMVIEQKDIIDSEKPDRVIYGGKAIYPIVWGMDHANKSIFLSPVPYITMYTKDHAHIGFNGNYGPWINKMTYNLANFSLKKHIISTFKNAKMPRIPSKDELDRELINRKMIYLYSTSIIPNPDYWPSNARVLGFHERDKSINWQADQALLDFLKKHDKIIFITFGSMTNPEPKENTSLIIKALEKHKIPAIINGYSGGLSKPDGFESNLIHFVERIPYDWVFPKVYGVIHHGGAGTTQMALKYACPSMIVPHIIDQFMWKDIVYNLGVGPQGIKMSKLNGKSFEDKLIDLYQNEAYNVKAKEISSKMAQEDWTNDLLEMIIEE